VRITLIISVIFVYFGLCIAKTSAQIEPLPPSINTAAAGEGYPVISADGKTLYFARTRAGIDGSVITDIWVSTISSTGQFSEPQLLQGNLRSRYGIVVVSVSPDNNTLYCTGKLTADTPPEDRIFTFRRMIAGWSRPQTIKIRDLHQLGATSDYCFGPDQKTLIMGMVRDTTSGGMDLYVSFLDETANEWSQPMWLGSSINSPYNEVTPFLAADGTTLFFSCDKPGNVGELEVYYSTRLDNSWRNWSQPKRLDAPVNRKGRTSYFTIDASGTYAYFAWRPNVYSTTDIYRYRLEKKTARALLLQGRITDEFGSPLEAVIRYERLDNDQDKGIAHSHPLTGEYSIVLPYGAKYSIYAERKDHYPVSAYVETSTDDTLTILQKDITLITLKKDVSIRLNNIFFESDKAELLQESRSELERLIAFLRQQPTVTITLEGHTDSTGSRMHNITLSQLRAEAIKKYLTAAGIHADRLRAIGYGPDKPAAANTTEEGRAMNRRVEFRIDSN
jgi:outer membrane protein OmpA-like peptidoglycan-associated protein